MATVPVVMPQLGESVAELVLARWFVKEGDTVVVDQVLAEVSSDQAETELPSPVAGTVARLLVAEGQAVAVNALIAEIATEVEAPRPALPVQPSLAEETAASVEAHRSKRAGLPGRIRTSPLVRKMARAQGVDLTKVAGSGAGGRVTKQDLLDFVGAQGTETGPRAPPPTPAPTPGPSASAASSTGPHARWRPPEARPGPGDRLVPFSRRRRLIAEHMVYSHTAAPHVTCVAEVDLHRVMKARAEAAARGEKLSYTAFVARAAVGAVRDVPTINASVLEDAYVVHARVHLGIAVETEEGLIVPVVKNADELSLLGMTRTLEALADRARSGKLSPEELSGGTLTLSNPGARGNLWGTPIIHQPQVAILRMGEVVKRPVVLALEGEEVIAVRPMMYLALSYDHRVVDGVAGNGYLRRVKERLEASTTERPG